jgi:hypothetical protein
MNPGTSDPFFREREMTSGSSHYPCQKAFVGLLQEPPPAEPDLPSPRGKKVFAGLSALPNG